jgi:photosystem II stability/assembly factor-like uncharacterized protein
MYMYMNSLSILSRHLDFTQNFGSVVFTSDAGLKWSSSKAPGGKLATFAAANSLGAGVVCGASVGKSLAVSFTADAGADWEQSTRPDDQSPLNMCSHVCRFGSTENQNAFMFTGGFLGSGHPGVVISHDGGATLGKVSDWDWLGRYMELPIATAAPTKNTWYIAGGAKPFPDTTEEDYAAVIQKTTDGGVSYTNVYNSHGNFTLVDIACVDEDTCVVLAQGNSSGSVILRTQNGGKKWTKVLQKHGTQVVDLSMVDADTMWVSGTDVTTNALFLHSKDAGQTWKVHESGLESGVVPGKMSWVVGESGEPVGFATAALHKDGQPDVVLLLKYE